MRVFVLVGLAALAAFSLSGLDRPSEAFADSLAGIAYRIGTSGGLGYREWDPATSSWSPEASLTSAGSQIEAVKFLYSPAAGSELRVIGVRETNGEIDIYYCTADCTNAANWNGPNLVVDMGSPTGGRKYFDMAFEHSSGDLLVVYTRTTTTETNDFFYQVFESDTLTLSGESGFDYIDDTTANNDIRFFQLASKPGSDEIAMALLDATNSDLVAFIWDGSSFGSQLTVTDAVLSGSLTGESFGIAYESSSGSALVVGPGLATNEVRYARYDESWSAVSALAGGINPGLTNENPLWMTLKSDPNPVSDKIMACMTDSGADFSCVQFDGGVPGTPVRHETATGGSSRRGDFAWTGWNSTGLALWYDNGAGSYQYSRWNSPTSTWGTESTTAAAQAFIWITAITDNDSSADGIGSLWAIYSPASPDNIGEGEYDSTTFTLNGLDTISNSAGTANTDDVVSLDSRRPRSSSSSIGDSINAVDDMMARITGKGIPDSLNPADSISRVYLQPRSASDSITLSDSISTSTFSPGHAKLSNAILMVDAIKIRTSRAAFDSVSVSDFASKTPVKALSDLVMIGDIESIHTAKMVSDVLTVTDPVGGGLFTLRSITDTTAIADSIPSDSNPAGMAYRSNTGSGTSFPKYREWNPETFAWSQEVELPDAGSPVRVAWIEFSPVSSKRVIVTLSDDGFLDSYACDDMCTQADSWTVQNNVAQVRSSLSGIERPFDIEFEKTSGDLMLAYDRVSTDSSQDLFYRVMPDASSAFGSEISINDTTSADTDVAYTFIRMDSRRTSGSNAIAMIALDATNSDAVAWVWDGSEWGSEHELTSSLSITASELIGVAYESSSGNLLVAAGEGTDVRYNRFTTLWQTSSTSSGTWAVGNINWLNLVPNPDSSSDEIFLAATGSASDLDSAYWDGSGWTDHTEHDDALGGTAGRGFDFAWDGDSSNGVLIWRTTAGQLDFKRFATPDSFSAQGSFLETANHNWIQLATNPETADYVAVLGATIDTNNDIGGIRWDGSGRDPVSTGDNAITATSLDTYESFSVDFQKAERISKPADDVIVVGESVARKLNTFRAISESLSVTDDPRGHIPTSLAESLTVGDAIAKSVSKSISDLVATSESVNLQFEGQFSVSVSDAVSLVDSASRLRVVPLSLQDSIAASDALSTEARRFPTDSLSLTESASQEKSSIANSSKAGAAYRSNTGTNLLQSPKYREWDPSTQTWSAEVELPSTGSDVRDARVLFSQSSSLRVIVSLSADGSLNLFKCDASCTSPGGWTHVNGASFANVGSLGAGTPYRPFDIAFEQDAGTLLMVYDKDATEEADFYYRTFDGIALSAEGSLDYIGSSADAEEILYFKMASKAGSDEITMVLLDDSNTDSYAFVWNGSSFGNQLALSTSLSTPNRSGESVGVAYETSSGASVAFSGNGLDSASVARWSGSSWSSVQTTDSNTSTSPSGIRFVRLASDPAAGSNKIMLCEADQHSDLLCVEIDSGVIGTWVVHDTDITTIATRTFDFAWNPADSKGILAWGTAAGSKSYSRYDGSWGTPLTTASAGTNRWIVGATSPSEADVANSIFLTLNSVLDIGTSKFKFGVLELLGDSTHTADTAANTYEGMSIDFQKSSRVSIFVSDALALDDEPSSSTVAAINIDDSLDIGDDLKLKVSDLRFDNTIAVTDTIGIGIKVPVDDGIGISDLLVGGRSINISDSVGIDAALTEIAWSGIIALDEGLVLSGESCTPTECQLNLHIGESLGLQDDWVPPPSFEEVIAVTDSIVAGRILIPNAAESLNLSELPETSLAVAPPGIPASWDLTEMPRAAVVTDASLAEPAEAQKLPGVYDMSGGIDALLAQTSMPVYSVSQMTSATDMTGKTLVLPLFQASSTPTAELPGHNVILTPLVDVLPANVPVSLPIDINSTLSEEAITPPVNWMQLDYAPGVSGANFALSLSMLDSKPTSAQNVQAELSAFFMDIDWTGTFAGSSTPSDPDFYASPPDLTFAITDAWATSQGLARNQNGVPVMEMFLLNDATGEWEPVTQIDAPSSVENGLYTYTAHLEHFSTYVATSTRATPTIGRINVSEPAAFVALLSDSISVGDAPKSGALQLIEEFTGSKRISVKVFDILGILVKPIAFGETLQVGKDLSVAIALDGVSLKSIVPPEARAILILEVANRGENAERFLMHLQYRELSGRTAYEYSEIIEIGPFKSLQKELEVPFTSAGDFVIDLDARAEDDNRILGTAQIEVSVPWLAINTYVIIAAAAIVFAGTGATMAYILRRR